jgi:hypothetical protein
MTRRRHRLVLALFVWSGLASETRAQDAAGPPSPVEASGAVNVNTKGISLVPALTLGRPAAIFDLAVRKRGLSFEPQLRFALDGKPWSFLLWGRYRAVTGEKFRITVGGHPAFSFRTTTTDGVDGRPQDLIEVRRYIAGEVTPTWVLSPRVSAGGYYLYSHGIDPGAPPHTHLAAARAYLSNIQVFGDYVVQAAPQLYFLRTNGQNGTYLGASASFGRRGSPWSIGAIVNQPIRSDVVRGQSFLWNVGVNYAFRLTD